MHPSPPPLAAPGTKEYLPSLLARARAVHPDLPLDAIILQSLLLCLIAQTRSPASHDATHARAPSMHLVLRTREEDVGLVVNLVTLTLTHILGVSAHKSKLAPKSTRATSPRVRASSQPQTHAPSTDRPDEVLRSLFFHRPKLTSFSSHRSSTPRIRSGLSLDATSRTHPTSPPIAIPTSPGKPKTAARNTSYFGPQATQRSPVSYGAPSTDGEDDDRFYDGISLASSRRPLLGSHTPASTLRSRGSRGRPGAQRLRTDPLPLSTMFSLPGATEEESEGDRPPTAQSMPGSIHAQKSTAGSERTADSGGTASALPRAVVVSGLEHTTRPVQRALLRVLMDRRLVIDDHRDDDAESSGAETETDGGSWNLPDGFLLVYVCPWDPHERPAILPGLIDRFGMSANVALPSSARQGYLAFRAAHAPTPRGSPFPSPATLPSTSSSPAQHSPLRRPTPLPHPSSPPHSSSHTHLPLLPPPPPVLAPADLAHLRTLARAYPPTGPILYPAARATTQVLPDSHSAVPAPAPRAALHPSLALYVQDLLAAARHHPALDGGLLSLRAHADLEALARAFRVLFGDSVGAGVVEAEARAWAREELEVDEASPGWGAGTGTGTGTTTAEGEAGSVVGEEAEAEMSPAEKQAAATARLWPETWDVSEEDVARVFPRVVSHRVRVLDGPEDEVLGSVMWPAVVDTARGDDEERERIRWERKAVKDVLVRILADV